MKASDIAELVDGTLKEGDDDPDLTGVAPLDRAGPTDLSLLAHPRYLRYAEDCLAGAILVNRDLAANCAGRTRIIVEDPHAALAKLLPRLYPAEAAQSAIHPTAVLGPGAQLGEAVTIGPYAVIEPRARIGSRCRIGAHAVIGEDCELAEDVVLFPHVTLYANARIGPRSILHAGVRVGVDGFGYAFSGSGHAKVPQIGRCVIGADCEIGANTTIDRGSIGATEIGDGVKIDNLVHIAHNVRIGAHSILVAQVGIAGSTTIGQGVTLAGQAGIPGHLHIGDGATIAAQAGVFGDVPAGATYSGYPARPHRESLRTQAGLARLPRFLRRLQALEKAVFPSQPDEE
ncbi:MAG: UDP-3-O-(3-hydroxymyristoyl)glucosamine N-acyltransferase [Longimicrobiales bacterium]